jgi:DNA-binding MarR family transcriptional regulator
VNLLGDTLTRTLRRLEARGLLTRTVHRSALLEEGPSGHDARTTAHTCSFLPHDQSPPSLKACHSSS